MKFLAVLWLSCSLAYGHSHNLILKLDSASSIQSVLTRFQVTSWKQLGNKPNFKVEIESSLSRSQLISSLYTMPQMSIAETNQSMTLNTLESAASIDSRIIFFLDDIEDVAIYDRAALDSRIIFFLDGQESFAPIYDQYHATAVRAQSTWQYSTGRDQIVAVLDTGVDVDHPFLVDNLLPGYDFVDNDTNPDEERNGLDTNENELIDEGYGHGSHVAGVLKSVAPDVSILPIKVADSDGQADLSSLISGIDFAISHGARVINLSMSISEPSTLLQEALNRAQQANIVVVTSAGNENSDQLKYPSTEAQVLTVTSVGPTYVKSSFSNYGGLVDVSAPGEQIVSCMPGGYYVARSGTSMSSPIIAGQAAIILQLVPSGSVSYVSHRILNNVMRIKKYNPNYTTALGSGFSDFWDSITLN